MARRAWRADKSIMTGTPSTSPDAAAILDAALEAYVRLDSAFRYSFLNRAAEQLLGKGRTDLLGKTPWELHPAIAGTALEGACRRAMTERVPVTIEDCHGTRQRWYAITVTPDTEDGIVVRAADITERKWAEETLRESEERFAAFMSNLPAAAFVKGEDGRTLFANRYLQELLGFKNWEGEATRRLIPGEVGKKMEEDDRKALAQGPLKFNETIVDSHGASRIFETTKFPIRLGPTTTLLGGIATEITERIRMEAALRESEVRFRAVFMNGPDALYTASLEEGRIIDVNSSFEAVFGYSRDEVIGKTPLELGLYADPAGRTGLLAELKAKGRIEDHEVEGRKKSGELFWCSLSVARMMLNGEAHIAGAIRDITAVKRSEAEREKLSAQLAQAQKMESVGRLAGGVAHDFNNLLTVINGYSKMMLRDLKAGDPLRDGIEEIYKAGKRAAGLTRQLLAFSRKQVLEPRRLDINRVLREMRPMLERLVGEDVEVRVALHAEGATVHADPHQLEQVVMNLAVNSRDAMPRGGKLLIETSCVERDKSHTGPHAEARPGRYVVLAVSDTGVGLDEETKSRIFEPFFTTKGVGKGTGLGLSMVQGIVAQSGGWVEVFSEKGNGTTFKIHLPALEEAAADAGRPEAVPALRGKETVLVVEDQAEVRKYAAAVLKEYGYRVIPVEDAREALLLFGREHIDLVLTDVVMPHVSGRELADRLEKLQPGVKVLFMSGYIDDVIADQGVLREGAKFIQKPFSPEELAGKVRAVLGPAPAFRILVADDEAGVRAFLRRVLEDGGYETIEAADGKQTLRQALAGRVDLVITDLVMPEQEGIETIQALRRDVPDVAIIAISGAFEGKFLKSAKLLGAAAVLDKPVSAQLLLATVAEVLKPRGTRRLRPRPMLDSLLDVQSHPLGVQSL
jgi:PAS domain S-box-containing protein